MAVLRQRLDDESPVDLGSGKSVGKISVSWSPQRPGVCNLVMTLLKMGKGVGNEDEADLEELKAYTDPEVFAKEADKLCADISEGKCGGARGKKGRRIRVHQLMRWIDGQLGEFLETIVVCTTDKIRNRELTKNCRSDGGNGEHVKNA